MTANNSSMENSAAKAAKKRLKRVDSGSIKLKALAKHVVGKIADHHPDANVKAVKKVLQGHTKFAIDGKMVSLNNNDKKRKVAAAKTESNKKKLKTNNEKSTSSSQSDVQTWRTEHKIILKDTLDDEEGQKRTLELQMQPAYRPYTTFDDCVNHIDSALIQQCTVANGFTKPSPIQAQCWPVLLGDKKRDVVGIAETGSGKTLAFAMPALTQMAKTNKSMTSSSRRKPRMLVLAPTRELAMQSHQVLQEFGAVVGLNSLVVYGGVPKYSQTAELKRGTVDCIVATPGRLLDLLQEGSCDLSQIQHLVLDEADRMLDMGFEQDVRQIISHTPCEGGRSTAMFSATWPAAIQKIALDYMTHPVRIYVGFQAIVGSNGEDGGMDDSLSANKRVAQTVEVIEDRAREARLEQLLAKHHGKNKQNRVLVFCLYKKEAERLEYSLRRAGWNCCSIHGNKNQAARTTALAKFKDGSCPLLVATDVAARGLDIPNVEAVINFTFPLTIEDYVHRIGRTGRAGKMGISHTFFQPSDKSHAGELQQVMRQAGQAVPPELAKFGSTIKKKEHKLYGNFGPSSSGGAPMKKATKIKFDY